MRRRTASWRGSRLGRSASPPSPTWPTTGGSRHGIWRRASPSWSPSGELFPVDVRGLG